MKPALVSSIPLVIIAALTSALLYASFFCLFLIYKNNSTTFDLFSNKETVINIGEISSGATVERIITLLNTSNNLISLDKPTSSCECLSISLSNYTVPSRSFVTCRLKIDTTKESSFKGALLLTAEGTAKDFPTRKAFTIRLKVDVK